MNDALWWEYQQRLERFTNEVRQMQEAQKETNELLTKLIDVLERMLNKP